MKMAKGFSLIELLVAISIMGLIIAIGVTNFKDFTVNQQVDSSSRDLGGKLHSIQSSAAAGVKPSSCTGILSGYFVRFNQAAGGGCGSGTRSTSFTVSALCPGQTSPVTTNLPTDSFLCVNRSAANANFTFKTIQSGTDINPANPFVITLGNIRSQKTLTITIYATGEIK